MPKTLQALFWLTLIYIQIFGLSDIDAKEPSYQDCISCHENEYQHWQKSDHAKSMAIADESSVLADFDDVIVSHHGQKAKIYRENSHFMVAISYDDQSETYPVKYSFGFYPLQQYLVETGPGKLQVLPFSWDSRSKVAGGQRWYHNYSNEEIRPQDRLHWRQPLQNWNGMCADCHSDGLVRNYNTVDNSFDTQFDNINVGCSSCHSDKSSHSTQQKVTNKTEIIGHTSSSEQKQSGQWFLNNGEKTAKWQGEPRDNGFMETCFACHSLRSPLTDGIIATKPYLDQFTPQMLFTPLYYADGQISEEAYIYGSFLQSKMFTAGVNCTDCHDKHSMKLKAEGNGLCLQCHAAEFYNIQKHHHHPADSVGAQCSSCHMPDNRYMGVDDRSDHSFKIPRPDISKEFNTPDVCIKCHKGRTSTWSESQLKEWFGQPGKISTTLHNYYQLQTGTMISLEEHLAIIADEKLPVITRATALQLLNRSTDGIRGSVLNLYLSHSESLLRLSAAMVANLISETERALSLAPLLQDKFKAVRVAAARNLVNVLLTEQQKRAFDRAFKELTLAMDINSWRGEGRANRAVMEVDKANWNEAENSLLAAIKIDPYFESGYLNLAEVYRHQNKINQESQILDKALALFPYSADSQYAFGLYLVRQKQYHKATLHFERAVSFAPEVEQYAYAYILSLDGEGKTREAMGKLQKIIHRYGSAEQLQQLGRHLYSKLQGH